LDDDVGGGNVGGGVVKGEGGVGAGNPPKEGVGADVNAPNPPS
jgi:hypothetical protein